MGRHYANTERAESRAPGGGKCCGSPAGIVRSGTAGSGIAISTADGKTTLIFVGDTVPDGHAYYVQITGTRNIATIDRSWHEVLARLVREPPRSTPLK